MRKQDAFFKIFLKYVLKNILILLLPTVLALFLYQNSLQLIQNEIDNVISTQLENSKMNIERLVKDIFIMITNLSNEYEINYYMNKTGELSGIEYYNLRRIYEKILQYKLSNELVEHCFIHLNSNDLIIFENGVSYFDSFYDILFLQTGVSSEEWKRDVLENEKSTLIIPQEIFWSDNRISDSLVIRKSIGYGDYRRGSVVVIVSIKNINRLLSNLAKEYGGWVWINDSSGGIIASTLTSQENFAASLDSLARLKTIQIDGESYRYYSTDSSILGWTFTAVLNENVLLKNVNFIRNITIAISAVILIAGLILSYYFARNNAKPVTRIMDLIFRNEIPGSEIDLTGIYEQAEEIIMDMTNNNMQMEKELETAGNIAQTLFFQNLLTGNYKSSTRFEKEKGSLHIKLKNSYYFILLCRIAPLNAVNTGESYSVFYKNLELAAKPLLKDSDFMISISFDNIVIIRHIEKQSEYENNVLNLISGIKGALDSRIRRNYAFSSGRPQKDPFLLMLSYNEAIHMMEGSVYGAENSELIYNESDSAKDTFYYPINVEEGIISAVQAGNRDLLESMFTALKKHNFEKRVLSLNDLDCFYMALKCTIYRIKNDFPELEQLIKVKLLRDEDQPYIPEDIDEVFNIFRTMTEIQIREKKIHASSLADRVHNYIIQNFNDPDIGLTKIADTFQLSENYLSNIYKEQSGECLSSFIQQTRIEKAVTLLNKTRDTVDKIAVKTGYHYTSSFRRAFKRVTGLSPTEYRKRLLKRKE